MVRRRKRICPWGLLETNNQIADSQTIYKTTSYKIASIEGLHVLPANILGTCPSTAWWPTRGRRIFPKINTSPPKNKAISTISQAKNQTTGTERRVLKSYHPRFEYQAKRCHQRRVMLISVLNHCFLAEVRGAPCGAGVCVCAKSLGPSWGPRWGPRL